MGNLKKGFDVREEIIENPDFQIHRLHKAMLHLLDLCITVHKNTIIFPPT